MASGPVEDAGVEAACPRCGNSVKQHSMIPVLENESDRRHICVDCARSLIPAEALPASSHEAASDA